jgi:chromosome segregation ATPase
MAPLFEEVDGLEGLEDRILKAVELLNKLKEENHTLRDQLSAAQAAEKKAIAELDSFKSSSSSAEKELELLRAERKQVKNRIEKLLGQMDHLAE